MTSHISVSSGSTAQGATGLSNTGQGKPSGGLGVFGAILDALAGGTATTNSVTTSSTTTAMPDAATAAQSASASASAAASSTNSDTGLTAILDLIAKLLGQSPTSTTTGETNTALSSTAATDASATAGSTDAGTPPKLLKDVLEALKQLSDAQQSGQPAGDDLLKKAKKAIDALQAYLVAQQPVAPLAPTTVDPATASDPPGASAVGAPASTGGSAGTPTANDGTNSGQALAAQIDTARASLNVLSSKLEQLSTATSKQDADLSGKLDALAKSLDPAKLTADTLGQLGLTGNTANADPKLATAINGLANGKPATAAASVDMPLATPRLQVPDGSALSAKSDGKAKPGLSQGSATTSTTSPADATLKPAAATSSKNSGGNSGAGSDSQSQNKAAAQAAQATAATSAPADASTPTDGTSSGGAAASVASGVNTASIATARLAQTAYQAAPTPQVNLSQVAYELVRNVQQGVNHFQIKLDPADLGKVDVKLSIDSTGTVNAHLTVERSDTLDLLKRDQSQLGQALTQSGLDSSKTNLQFSLSQNPFTRQDNGSANGNGGFGSGSDTDDDTGIGTIDASQSVSVYAGTASSSGLNLFV